MFQWFRKLSVLLMLLWAGYAYAGHEQPSHFEDPDIWFRRIMDTDFEVNNP